MSDLGSICLQGWTAGQLNNPKFDWVGNVKKRFRQQEVDSHHENISSVFAMFWNLGRQKCPAPIIQNFEEFLTLVNPPRLQYNPSVPSFTISLNSESHQIHNQPFAPPSGQTTYNYSRYIHTETNATRYMILWFTDRQCSSSVNSVECGGNFFLASYGIRVRAERDTFIAWEPKKAHGTSLMERGDSFIQRGLSIGIGNRLGSVWEKFRSGLYFEDNMEEEVAKAFEEDEEHEDIIDEEEGELVD